MAFSSGGWVSRLGRLTLGVALAFVAGELLVRFAAPQPKSWLEVYRRHPDLPVHALLPSVSQLAFTGETHWTCRTDEMGFRCGADPAPAAGFGVVWLGDSFTFGHGVEYEDSFVGRLQSDASQRVTHWNTAAPGYGPQQYEMLLDHHLKRLGPDMVMAGLFVGNDFHDCLWDKDVAVTDGVLGKSAGMRAWLKSVSHVYRLLASVAHSMGWGASGQRADLKLELADAEAWRGQQMQEAVRRVRRSLTTIRSAMAARGGSFAVLIIPTREAVAAVVDGDPVVGDPLMPVRVMREMLDDLAIDYLDATGVLASLPGGSAYLKFDGHLTMRAHEVVARAIAERWPCLVTGR